MAGWFVLQILSIARSYSVGWVVLDHSYYFGACVPVFTPYLSKRLFTISVNICLLSQ